MGKAAPQRVLANQGAYRSSSLPPQLWPDAAGVDRDGRLTFGSLRVGDLVARYGTPLYVYDAATLRSAHAAYRRAFAPYAPARVAYSVKACGLLGVLAVFRGASASVASLGELETATAAGLDPRRAWLHGNAKSEAELRGALRLGIGRVVVDGEAEVERLAAVARSRTQDVWLRLNPAIAADTHAKLRTGALDQKFGVPIGSGDALRVARRIASFPALRLVGLHLHLGSQIGDLGTFARAAEALVAFARTLASSGLGVRELCAGGGLFAPQTRDEPVPDLGAYARAVCAPIRSARDLGRVTIAAEPGRSLVGRAGVALYRVLERKVVQGARTFVAVDGGMGDNVRPALYGARYEAALADRPLAAAEERVAIAGAYCEAGDVLVDEVALPVARVGELLAMPAVGAYAVAMASNYNQRPRPAVVLVDRGRVTLIRRRERTADLLRLERTSLATRARAGRGSRAG